MPDSALGAGDQLLTWVDETPSPGVRIAAVAAERRLPELAQIAIRSKL